MSDARRYMVSVLSYGRWGFEQTAALTRAEADALAARLSALPHVTSATVVDVYA